VSLRNSAGAKRREHPEGVVQAKFPKAPNSKAPTTGKPTSKKNKARAGFTGKTGPGRPGGKGGDVPPKRNKP
jgi:hypothetical protein